jgi:ABC-type multidrug transport system fused ATPase/permease subunit
LLTLIIIKSLRSYYEGLWTEVVSQNVAYDLRDGLQRKISELSFAFPDQAAAGDLLSRVI